MNLCYCYCVCLVCFGFLQQTTPTMCPLVHQLIKQQSTTLSVTHTTLQLHDCWAHFWPVSIATSRVDQCWLSQIISVPSDSTLTTVAISTNACLLVVRVTRLVHLLIPLAGDLFFPFGRVYLLKRELPEIGFRMQRKNSSRSAPYCQRQIRLGETSQE